MKKLLSLAAVTMALVLFTAPTAFAAEFIAPKDDNQNITLSKGETHKNVYIAAGSVFVNSDVSGDLFGAGGTIIVEGNIEQDAVVAGGTVMINGNVGGDIRVAGGEVTINGSVSGDVLVAGGTVRLTEKASVAGDLAAGAGDLSIDGIIAGSVKIAGGVVRLNSSLPGSVKVVADEKLTVGSKAIIPGGISFKGSQEAVVEDGAQVGTINFEKVAAHQKGALNGMMFAIFSIAFVIKALGLILAGLLLMKLFPRTAKNSVDSMRDGMWRNTGVGFIALIVGPIVAILLLVTLFGMYIAGLLFFAWLIMLILSILVACVFSGAWIIMKLTKKESLVYNWQALVIGVVAIAILSIVPVIGGIAFLILLMMAFGGIIRQFYSRIKSEQGGAIQ